MREITDRMKNHLTNCWNRSVLSPSDIALNTDKNEENKGNSVFDKSKVNNISAFKEITENNNSSDSKRSTETVIISYYTETVIIRY